MPARLATIVLFLWLALFVLQGCTASGRHAGFQPLFNGKDLGGWKGLVADPPTRAKMSAEQLAGLLVENDEARRLR